MTPEYYDMDCGDLYNHFKAQYGYVAVRNHLLMEAQQYLHRCLSKGQYSDDLHKVRTIVDRLLAWHLCDMEEE